MEEYISTLEITRTETPPHVEYPQYIKVKMKILRCSHLSDGQESVIQCGQGKIWIFGTLARNIRSSIIHETCVFPKGVENSRHNLADILFKLGLNEMFRILAAGILFQRWIPVFDCGRVYQIVLVPCLQQR